MIFEVRKTDIHSEEILGPLTSTPAVRKSKPKGRLTIGEHKLTVSVFDGLATRHVTITTLDALFDLLEKVSKTLKRPNTAVEMGYEAPWSSKVNSKKCLAYVTNEEELNEFWLSYVRYTGKQKGKKPKEVTASDIVFRNMKDTAQVSRHLSSLLLSFFHSCSVLIIRT